MKDNPLMKYSEQLAVEIEKMCKSLDNKKTIRIQFCKFVNHPQVYLQISPKHNILKVYPICFPNSKSHEKNVLKQKAG